MMIENRQPCKYCGTQLLGYEKDEARGKWINYNLDRTVHEYKACKAIQNNKLAKADKITSVMPAPDVPKYFPQNNPPPTQPTGININSVYIKASNAEKEVKELRKQVETLSTIIDGMAQNITLLVQKVGYPEPRPITREETTSESLMDNPPKRNAMGEQVIDSKDVEGNPAFIATQEKIKNELNEEASELIPGAPHLTQNFKPAVEIKEGWTLISEKFICHGCESTKFNGYEKYGTKLCDECKTNIDAQEALDKINAEPEKDEHHQHLRSISDINEEAEEML